MLPGVSHDPERQRDMPEFTCNVAVIGAGLGGLAAGVGILKAGHRVSIIERAPILSEVLYTTGT